MKSREARLLNKFLLQTCIISYGMWQKCSKTLENETLLLWMLKWMSSPTFVSIVWTVKWFTQLNCSPTHFIYCLIFVFYDNTNDSYFQQQPMFKYLRRTFKVTTFKNSIDRPSYTLRKRNLQWSDFSSWLPVIRWNSIFLSIRCVAYIIYCALKS